MRHLLLLFIFQCLHWSIQAQPICKIQTYNTNDGLSQSLVQRLFQDNDGLLWMCTWNGLDCYDGYSFTNYNMSAEGGKALTTNRITIISPTSSDDIWCRTYDGRIYLFNKKTRTFIDMLAKAEQKLKETIYIERLYTLRNGITWLIGRDGLNFRVDESHYSEEDGIRLYSTSNNTLKGEIIYNVSLDKEGNEWVLTNNGVTIIGKKHLEYEKSFRFFKEKSNNIFLFSDDGCMVIYDKNTDKTECRKLPAECKNLNSVAGLPNGYLGLTSKQGFWLYSIKGKSFTRYSSPGSSDDFIALYYNDKECWVLTADSHMLCINLYTLERKDYRLPDFPHTTDQRKGRCVIFEDKNSTLWVIPSVGSMCYYDEADDEFKLYLQNPNDPNSNFAPYIRFYTFDRQGNLWFASHSGVTKLSCLPHFYNLQMHEKNMDTRAFLQDKMQRTWIGSQSGIIYVYDQKEKTPRYLSANGEITSKKCKFSSGAYAILQDKRGNIWVGTKGKGLYCLEPVSADRFKVTQYQHKSNEPYSLGSDQVYSLHEDRQGRIWIGSFEGGLNLLTWQDGHARFIHSGNDWKKTYPDTGLKVRFITTTPDDILLVGTQEGLISLSTRFENPADIRFYRNQRRANEAHSLNGNDVMHIFRNSKGEIYVSTFTGGVNRVVSDNLLSDSIHFEQMKGLPSNLVHSMFEDNDGNLWIIFENMLSKYDPHSRLFINYNSNTFRSQIKFSEAIPLSISRQRVLIGTNQGVLEINPEKMKVDNYVPTVLFNDIRIQGNLLQDNPNKILQITLSPSQRNIIFSFVAIDMVGSQDIQYAYRLRGLEKDWNNVGKTRAAAYMKLPVGTYTLEIKSTNNNGIWMDNVRSLKLVVKPTFGETIWAKLLYAMLLIILAAVIMLVLFYIYRLRHRIDMEQQLADIKLRFFTDISHELRTPLTLISGPVDEVLQDRTLSQKSRENLMLAHNNVVRMLRLMTQILDFRKIQNQKMKVVVEKIELIGFLRQLMTNFQSLATEQNISFQLRSELPELSIWLDRDKADKIFFNLISNAFKYTPAGKSISLEVRTTGNYAEISVKDEGIGIEPSKQERIFKRFENIPRKDTDFWKPSSGIGLSLVKEMTGLMHGSIQLKSTPGKGSCFTVYLPLKRSVYDEDKNAEFILNDGSSNVSDNSTPENKKNTLPPATDENKERLTILVVEDNNELRQFLNNILSEQYQVIEAVNGREGVEKARSSIPDLIITDVMMPVMDGLEMVRQLKLDINVCHIPIIVLSAKASLDDRIASLEEGIDDYITKPFSATYLKTRIASLLRRQKQLQEIYMARLQASAGSNTEEKATTNGKTEYEPSKPSLVSLDEQFIHQVIGFLEQNIANPDIKIEDFAEHLCLSRTVFYRKLKSITGLTPVEFIREIRLKRALQLMDDDSYTVAQIAYMTGFGDPNYFGRCFKKKTGMSPTEYKDKRNQ